MSIVGSYDGTFLMYASGYHLVSLIWQFIFMIGLTNLDYRAGQLLKYFTPHRFSKIRFTAITVNSILDPSIYLKQELKKLE